jgi:hypothetical protein
MQTTINGPNKILQTSSEALNLGGCLGDVTVAQHSCKAHGTSFAKRF